MLAKLRQKLGMLKYLGGTIPEKSKLQLVNGMILSRIIYLIPLYGGTYPKYLDKLQAIMNNSIRFVTGYGKRTKTRKLMEAVNWLNIHELEKFHTLLLTWKIVRMNTPQYMSEKIKIDQENKISTSKPRLQNTMRGFRWKSIKYWNDLDTDLREEMSLPKFKRNIRKWIINQRPPN